MADDIRGRIICLLVLFGILVASGKDWDRKFFPEEQVMIERCIALCNTKGGCPVDVFKYVKDPLTGESSCEHGCKQYPDCNVDKVTSALNRIHDRVKFFNSTNKNENFKEECAAHCEQVTGQEPLPGAKSAASVKMAKSECKIRCKIASYMFSD